MGFYRARLRERNEMSGTRKKSLRAPLCALAIATLWGCGAQMGAPAWYESPPGLNGANGATVSMSDNQAGGKVPDGDTRVVTVDGQTVSPTEWDKIVLPPGTHTLGVKYNGVAAIATVPISATLQAGDNYQVKGVRTGPCDAELWLEERGADQAPAAKLATHLTAKPSAYGTSVFAVACN
jgi:hypothetical protein